MCVCVHTHRIELKRSGSVFFALNDRNDWWLNERRALNISSKMYQYKKMAKTCLTHTRVRYRTVHIFSIQFIDEEQFNQKKWSIWLKFHCFSWFSSKICLSSINFDAVHTCMNQNISLLVYCILSRMFVCTWTWDTLKFSMRFL